MKKDTVLAILCGLMGILFSYPVFMYGIPWIVMGSIMSGEQSVESVGFSFLYICIPLCIILSTLYYAHRLLYKTEVVTKYDYLFALLALYTGVWSVLLVVGYYLAYLSFYPVLLFGVLLGMLMLTRKYFRNVSIFFLCISIYMASLSYVSGFKEGYCWEKGTEESKKTLVQIQKVTDEEAKELGLEKGAEATPFYISYMRCNYSFQFLKAVQDTYYPR